MVKSLYLIWDLNLGIDSTHDSKNWLSLKSDKKEKLVTAHKEFVNPTYLACFILNCISLACFALVSLV